MLKVALTHDVDRVKKSYQYISYLLKAIKGRDINMIKYHISSYFLAKDPYWNFDRIMEIEKMHDVKSTFFFLDESIKFKPFEISNWQLSLGRYRMLENDVTNVIKYLDKNGWEIGLHGSYNSYKDIELLKKEKETLENILGKKIQGIRQHYLNLDENTWSLQKTLGFKYDSSFGYTDRIGFKDKEYHSLRPFDDYFVVFPLIVMDSSFMQLSESITWSQFMRVCDEAELKGATLVINWHQRVFNEKEFPGYSKFYERMIKEFLKRKSQIDTLGNYYSLL